MPRLARVDFNGDTGGWHDLCITHFAEYVAGRSEADPRRPEAVFRLAQAQPLGQRGHHVDVAARPVERAGAHRAFKSPAATSCRLGDRRQAGYTP